MTGPDPVTLAVHGQAHRTAALVRAAHRIDALIDRERLGNCSLILLVFAAVAIAVSAHVAPNTVLPDYLAHWTGGRLLLDGRGGVLYDGSVQLEIQQRVTGPTDTLAWFVSPPFTAVLHAPLAALPIRVSAVVWTVLPAGALAASGRLARPLARASLQESWWLVLLVAAVSAPVFSLLGAGLDSAFLLLVWVAGTRLVLAQRDAAAGAVLALGLVKPQIVFLVPLVLLVRGRWRALGAFAATGVALAAVSVAAVGPASDWTSVVLPFSDAFQQGVQLGQAWKMQDVTALVISLLPGSWGAVAQLVGSVLAAALALALLVAVARHRRDGSRQAELWALVALYVTTWTTPARHALVSLLPWPLTVVGAAWTTLPLLVLAWCLSRSWTCPTASPSGPKP